MRAAVGRPRHRALALESYNVCVLKFGRHPELKFGRHTPACAGVCCARLCVHARESVHVRSCACGNDCNCVQAACAVRAGRASYSAFDPESDSVYVRTPVRHRVRRRALRASARVLPRESSRARPRVRQPCVCAHARKHDPGCVRFQRQTALATVRSTLRAVTDVSARSPDSVSVREHMRPAPRGHRM